VRNHAVEPDRANDERDRGGCTERHEDEARPRGRAIHDRGERFEIVDWHRRVDRSNLAPNRTAERRGIAARAEYDALDTRRERSERVGHRRAHETERRIDLADRSRLERRVANALDDADDRRPAI